MKRLLRVMILGPVYVIAALAFTLAAPIGVLVIWLTDDDVRGFIDFLGYMWVSGAKLVWTNELEL